MAAGFNELISDERCPAFHIIIPPTCNVGGEIE